MEHKAYQRIIRLEEKIDTLINLMLISVKDILTIKEVCRYTGLSASTIYKHTSNGSLKSYNPLGKNIFIRRSDLEQWLLRNPSNNQFININRKETNHG